MTTSNDRNAIPSKPVNVIFVLMVPLLYTLLIGPLFVQPLTTSIAYAVIGFAVYWALTFYILAITKFGEGASLASLGIKHLSRRMIAVAVGLGILLSVTVPLLTLMTSQIFPVSESKGVIDTAVTYPVWVIFLSVLTAGITEEIVFRGYAIERLLQLTDNLWISALISLIAFVLTHLSGWNLVHIVGVVLPMGAILTGLYLWQRNLIFVIIIHILVDLPMVLIALGS